MEKLQSPFDIVEVKKLHNLVAACQLFVYNFLNNNNNSKRIYFPTQLKTCLDLSQSFFCQSITTKRDTILFFRKMVEVLLQEWKKVMGYI